VSQLKNQLFLKTNIVVYAIFLIAGCANSAPSSKGDSYVSQKIEMNLAQGKAVIVYHMSNKDKESEQYADWSANLNEFYAAHSGKYEVFSADNNFLKILKANKLGENAEFSIFMKKGYPTYFYDGVIVEKAVYLSVDNKYSGKTLSGMDKAFLPKEINISFQVK